jgi:hypothetical protein
MRQEIRPQYIKSGLISNERKAHISNGGRQVPKCRGVARRDVYLLDEEVMGFQRKPVSVGSDFGRWRGGQHDGLVFSVALALWAASEGQSIGPVSGEIVAMFKWW